MPRCINPSCRSTKFTVVKKITEQQYCGELPGGERYTLIVRQRVRCRHCEQLQVHRSYHYDPEAWERQGLPPADQAGGEAAAGMTVQLGDDLGDETEDE